MTVLSFGLLFLPAAATWYWSISASYDDRVWIFGVHDGVVRNYGGRPYRYPHRLASRLEFSGCSVIGVSLLFLPAWDAFVVGRYWASSAQYENGVGQLRAFQFDMRGATNLTPDGYKTRASLFAISLASRSELSVVMVVVFGLLFLPAASHCWSRSSASPSSGYRRASAVYFWGISINLGTGAQHRDTRLGVRLASRSELFGCSVDGAGLLFLPAPDGKYVSVWTRTAEAVKASVGMRAAKVTGSVDSGVYLQALARQSRFLVRLASREDCPLWCRC